MLISDYMDYEFFLDHNYPLLQKSEERTNVLFEVRFKKKPWTRNIYGISFSRENILTIQRLHGAAHMFTTAPQIQGFITDMMRRLSKIEVAGRYYDFLETEDGKRWAWVPRSPIFRSRCLASTIYGTCIVLGKRTHVFRYFYSHDKTMHAHIYNQKIYLYFTHVN